MLATFLSTLGLGQVGGSVAYLADIELSTGNTFASAPLDIVLSNTTFAGVISDAADDQSQFSTNVSLLSGSVQSQYEVLYEETGGALCAELAVAASGPSSYDGPLSGFIVPATSAFGAWQFSITVTDGAPLTAGAYCEFSLVYGAWLSGVPDLALSGFDDEERLLVRIDAVAVASPVVINEILPNPDGALCANGTENDADCTPDDIDFIFDFGEDADDMPQGEWVELYNRSADPVDLAGWYIEDASGGAGNTTDVTAGNTAPAGTIIAAGGYLVVYINKAIFNNTGDTVKLVDASATLKDSYAYTASYDTCELVPTPGAVNDEDPAAETSCGANVPENKSYARIPDGTGAFVDPIPTPGGANKTEGVVEITEMGVVEVVAVEVSPVAIAPEPEPEPEPDPELTLEVVAPESEEDIGLVIVDEAPEVANTTLAVAPEIVVYETTIVELAAEEPSMPVIDTPAPEEVPPQEPAILPEPADTPPPQS